MYLEEPQIRELLRCLRSTFPRHALVCDLMSRKFLERYARSVHDKISDLRAPFKYAVGSQRHALAGRHAGGAPGAWARYDSRRISTGWWVS